MSNYIPIFPAAIDNSMRKELVKCQTAAKYRFELGLRAIGGGKVDLIAGGAYAKGMETLRRAFFMHGDTQEQALGQAVAACYQAYGNFQPPPKSNKTADRMAGALAFYCSEWPLYSEVLRPIKIEFGFAYGISIDHPVTGQELEYCGRFDAIVQDERGELWVMDDKTTSQMGDKWANQWALDSQMTGYCWGANKWLAEQGDDRRVKGAIINGIAIRLHDYGSMRLPVYRADWEIARWFAQMKANVCDWIMVFEDDDHDMALDHACAYYLNPCEFAPLCNSRNPERLFEGSYVQEFWNPKERKD